MITRAKVEAYDRSNNESKIRIPYFDKIPTAVGATATEDLYSAPLNILPGITLNPKIDDIVYVGFVDHYPDKPVILGYSNNNNNTTINIKAKDFEATGSVTLPQNTSIGNITAKNILCLKGITKNINDQIKELLASDGTSLTSVSPGVLKPAMADKVRGANRITIKLDGREYVCNYASTEDNSRIFISVDGRYSATLSGSDVLSIEARPILLSRTIVPIRLVDVLVSRYNDGYVELQYEETNSFVSPYVFDNNKPYNKIKYTDTSGTTYVRETGYLLTSNDNLLFVIRNASDKGAFDTFRNLTYSKESFGSSQVNNTSVMLLNAVNLAWVMFIYDQLGIDPTTLIINNKNELNKYAETLVKTNTIKSLTDPSIIDINNLNSYHSNVKSITIGNTLHDLKSEIVNYENYHIKLGTETDAVTPGSARFLTLAYSYIKGVDSSIPKSPAIIWLKQVNNEGEVLDTRCVVAITAGTSSGTTNPDSIYVVDSSIDNNGSAKIITLAEAFSDPSYLQYNEIHFQSITYENY